MSYTPRIATPPAEIRWGEKILGTFGRGLKKVMGSKSDAKSPQKPSANLFYSGNCNSQTPEMVEPALLQYRSGTRRVEEVSEYDFAYRDSPEDQANSRQYQTHHGNHQEQGSHGERDRGGKESLQTGGEYFEEHEDDYGADYELWTYRTVEVIRIVEIVRIVSVSRRLAGTQPWESSLRNRADT